MTIEELKNMKQELVSMQVEAMDSVNKRLIYTPALKTKFSDIYADVVIQLNGLIDAEIERQQPVVPTDRHEANCGEVFHGTCACGAEVSDWQEHCWHCGKRLEWPELSDEPVKRGDE